MKWTEDRSNNVEDRRGQSGKGAGIFGGGLATIIIAAVVFFLGGNPSEILSSGISTNIPQTTERQTASSEEDEKIYQFVSMLTAENEQTWEQIFRENGRTYRPAKVVLFTQTTQSGCGTAQSAMGPFYCPADETIYMDMSFFQELQTRYGAKTSEFTIAYVLAHEVGHHIQNLLGTLSETEKMRRSGRYTEAQMNRVSVATELQADFYAGLWARHSNERENYLTPQDIEAAISAAEAVGDDNIQKRAQGYVVQEAFTHGSSAQRKEWFLRGYESNDINKGNTFEILLK
ncbi:MAG: neutral zinc metallopeptidase [Bergeyella zoohelcum]|nr:neutral zinc metallopeptidase [Bergeyella zoohelcum]